MTFTNMDQLITSLRIFHKCYDCIRIFDINHQRILYECEEQEEVFNKSRDSFLDMHEATLSVQINNDVLEIVTSLRVNIESHIYLLELIQYDKNIPFLQMEKLAFTDSLTLLYNRRYINNQIPIDLKRSFQLNKPVTFIYIDIDHFKWINDHYGHVIGDHLLKQFASELQYLIQEMNSWVSRYGGDEFLISLPETHQDIAIEIANHIRSSIEKHPFSINNNILMITCSIGVQTVYKTSGVETLDQVIELVDKKLYKAKRKGRNIVVL